ncbi:MAG: hypothetical protein MUF39_06755 [Cyclobacteriaceae bacterium]|nr:hypothetical protein [Cyclobacteriaceae bacterium]
MSHTHSKSNSNQETNLSRQLGLTGLAATGICSMIGASIYVVPFMIQRNVPGIGPYVLPAFLFAAIPAEVTSTPVGHCIPISVLWQAFHNGLDFR